MGFCDSVKNLVNIIYSAGARGIREGNKIGYVCWRPPGTWGWGRRMLVSFQHLTSCPKYLVGATETEEIPRVLHNMVPSLPGFYSEVTSQLCVLIPPHFHSSCYIKPVGGKQQWELEVAHHSRQPCKPSLCLSSPPRLAKLPAKSKANP